MLWTSKTFTTLFSQHISLTIKVTYTNIVPTWVHLTNLRSQYTYNIRNAWHTCQVSVDFQKERTDIEFQMSQEDDLMTLQCKFLDGLMVTSGLSGKPLLWRWTPRFDERMLLAQGLFCTVFVFSHFNINGIHHEWDNIQYIYVIYKGKWWIHFKVQFYLQPVRMFASRNQTHKTYKFSFVIPCVNRIWCMYISNHFWQISRKK